MRSIVLPEDDFEIEAPPGFRFGDEPPERRPPEPRDYYFPTPRPLSQWKCDGDTTDWLVEGLIARRHATLAVGLPKVGKSTWLAHLIRSLQTGADFCGRKTLRARTLVVSEESHEEWHERAELLGFDDSLILMPRCSIERSLVAWEAFIRHVCEQVGQFNVDLVVLDTLGGLAPWRSENDAAAIHAAWGPLRELFEYDHYGNCGILAVHHASKEDAGPAMSARGSGALAGSADIIVDLRRVTDDQADGRRVLNCIGRLRGIPPEIRIRLAADGRSYTAQDLVTDEAPPFLCRARGK